MVNREDDFDVLDALTGEVSLPPRQDPEAAAAQSRQALAKLMQLVGDPDAEGDIDGNAEAEAGAPAASVGLEGVMSVVDDRSAAGEDASTGHAVGGLADVEGAPASAEHVDVAQAVAVAVTAGQGEDAGHASGAGVDADVDEDLVEDADFDDFDLDVDAELEVDLGLESSAFDAGEPDGATAAGADQDAGEHEDGGAAADAALGEAADQPAGATSRIPAAAPVAAAPGAPSVARRFFEREQRSTLGTSGEVAIWFLMLVLIEHELLGTGIGYVGLEPSPLWFPILWAALRGGLLPALATAGVATLLTALGYAADVGFSLTALMSSAVTWPAIVFTTVAYITGQARDVLMIDVERFRRGRDRWRDDAERRRREGEVLQHVNRELKRRVFDRSFDFESLMATMARTVLQGGEKAFDAPLGMLVEFCGATKCSVLYVLPDGVVDLAAHRGWTEAEVPSRLRAASRNGRVLRTIAEARPMVELGDDDVSPDGPLLVAPLGDSAGVIRALLCIDEIPPSRFEATTVKAFLGIASWVATNMRRMQSGGGDDSRQAMMMTLSASKSIGTPEQLSERIFLEDARRKRYSIDSVLVAVRIQAIGASMPDYVNTLEGHLASVLNSSVRLTDDVYRFGFAGCYVVVMTGCEVDNADRVVERLGEHFAANGHPELGAVELQPFLAGREAPDLASLLPCIADHFFGVPIAGLDQRCPVPEPHPQRSGNGREFVRRLRLETELARRFELDLSLVDFRGQGTSTNVGPMIARHLWNVVGSLLRVTDGIYVLGPNRCVVLLPCTACLEGTRIWSRLDDALRASLPDGRYEEVTVDYLALAGADARETMQHLVGAEETFEQAVGSLLSDNELSELSFSEGELAQIQGGGGGFVDRLSGADGSSGGFEGPDVFEEVAAELAAEAEQLEQAANQFAGWQRPIDATRRVVEIEVEADVQVDELDLPTRGDVEQRLDSIFGDDAERAAQESEPEQELWSDTPPMPERQRRLPTARAIEDRLDELLGGGGPVAASGRRPAPGPAVAPVGSAGLAAPGEDPPARPTARERLLVEITRLRAARDWLRDATAGGDR